MRYLIIALTLSACSHVPPDLARAKAAVDSRMTYVEYKAKAPAFDCVTLWEKHAKPVHLKANEGNCYDYAIAYRKQLGRGTVMKERRWDGVDHAFLAVGEYRLDVRYATPIPYYYAGCGNR